MVAFNKSANASFSSRIPRTLYESMTYGPSVTLSFVIFNFVIKEKKSGFDLEEIQTMIARVYIPNAEIPIQLILFYVK